MSSPLTATAGALPKVRRGSRVWSPSLVLATGMVGLVLLMVVVVPFLPLYAPFAQDLTRVNLRPFESSAHLLGTDNLGRDLLSRLALAGRTSLLIALPAVLVNLVLGLVLGMLAGYYGGKVDTLVSGLADVQLAIPIMLLLISIVAALGPSTWTLVLVIGLSNWMGYGRISRAISMSLRDRDFVWAPRTQGAGTAWVLRKHLLPNVVPSIAVMIPFDFGVVILIEAAMSYLGLGVQPPTPSWGSMIEEGQTYLRTDPHLTVLPGIALFLVVAGVQFISQRFTHETRTANS